MLYGVLIRFKPCCNLSVGRWGGCHRCCSAVVQTDEAKEHRCLWSVDCDLCVGFLCDTDGEVIGSQAVRWMRMQAERGRTR